MPAWSPNNLACRTTWTTLMVLDQSDETFDASGAIKVRDFTFWNNADSAEMRKTKATTLAVQMDNIFVKLRGARYETGVDAEAAIKAIVAILTKGDRTMADLAARNDASYQFWGEANA